MLEKDLNNLLYDIGKENVSPSEKLVQHTKMSVYQGKTSTFEIFLISSSVFLTFISYLLIHLLIFVSPFSLMIKLTMFTGLWSVITVVALIILVYRETIQKKLSCLL